MTIVGMHLQPVIIIVVAFILASHGLTICVFLNKVYGIYNRLYGLSYYAKLNYIFCTCLALNANLSI